MVDLDMVMEQILGTFIEILRKVAFCIFCPVMPINHRDIKRTENAKRHFSKNYNKRPGKRSIWVWLWKESWDVYPNSSKSVFLHFRFS